MKKTVVALFGLAMLSGCAGYYDYYKGGVRYTQDGEDCIFYAAERGRHYSEDIRKLDMDKKIVYRNTMCRDLYQRGGYYAACPMPYRKSHSPSSLSRAARQELWCYSLPKHVQSAPKSAVEYESY